MDDRAKRLVDACRLGEHGAREALEEYISKLEARVATAERERDTAEYGRDLRQLFAHDKLRVVALRWHRARYAFRGVPDPGEEARAELRAAESELDLWSNPSRLLIDVARGASAWAASRKPTCGCHCAGGCGDPYAACMRPCREHVPF